MDVSARTPHPLTRREDGGELPAREPEPMRFSAWIARVKHGDISPSNMGILWDGGDGNRIGIFFGDIARQHNKIFGCV